MAAAEQPTHDVLVCGLGPVGQLLALLLGRAGVSVLAIDAAPRPYDLPRAAVIDDEVLRILQSAGVAEAVQRQCQPQTDVSFVTRAGRPISILRPVNGSQGHHPLVSIHQPSLEGTLIDALREQETVEARWGSRLERLSQTADRVEVTVRDAEGGEIPVSARWLVGCDGGSSWVRQLCGIEFGGSTFRQRWLVVDATVDRPLEKVPHPHFYGDPVRPIVSLPMSPGRHRWEWMIHPGEEEAPFLDPASIEARIAPFRTDEAITIERAVVYTFHARIASRWRDGRVLLAGDAAHLMPPFAGQGFSTGARDAANLAWKLDAVLDGAPERLLDTYEAERRPHAAAFIRLAVTLGRFVQSATPRVAALRDGFLNASHVSGLSALMRERIKPQPAYRSGAFAERPARLPPKRDVGSQFPQPRVSNADGDEALLDDVVGPGWCAIAIDGESVAPLADAGLPTFLVGRDIDDRDGTIGEWLTARESSWVVLRPDRFVFARGSSAEAAAAATAALRRQFAITWIRSRGVA